MNITHYVLNLIHVFNSFISQVQVCNQGIIMYEKVKKRMYEILEVASPGDVASKIFDIIILTLIFLNVITVILETVELFATHYFFFFRIFELISVTIFTVEYVLRLWVCSINERFKGIISGRIRYAVTMLAIVDLIAIAPFYLPMVIMLDMRFMRAVRLFRLFRLLKIGRYNEALNKFAYVMKEKKEELIIVVWIVVILLVISSSLLYFVENEAQPDIFSSIPASMWWGVATLTTVGYGDIYPITHLGKFLGAIIAILGIGMFALPAGILASGFAEKFKKKNDEPKICPHCGKYIDKPPE